MLSVSPASIAANPGDANNLNWSFNSTPQAFNFLAAGESLTLTYTVKADDGHGGIDNQTVTITITGTRRRARHYSWRRRQRRQDAGRDQRRSEHGRHAHGDRCSISPTA